MQNVCKPPTAAFPPIPVVAACRDAPTDASADESKATPAPAAAQAPAATEAATGTAAAAATTDAGDGSSKAEEGEAAAEAKPVVSGPCSDDTDGFVHLDMMAAGMGMCCLQVTFQARDITESLRLYDQLAVLSPIVVCIMRLLRVGGGAQGRSVHDLSDSVVSWFRWFVVDGAHRRDPYPQGPPHRP